MRKTIASIVLAAGLIMAPVAGRAEDPGPEMGFSAIAAVCNLGYTPAKVVVAAVGMALGGVAGTLNGGDTRAAYAFWVPMVGGDYFLTSDMMDGRKPIAFFGSDYADRPSAYERTRYGVVPYEAEYGRSMRRERLN